MRRGKNLLKGFAVIDCEATGLNRERTDRVVEVAVATYDLDFNPTGQYETLINPERDLGPTALHGVDEGMVADAPKFADIAGDLSHLLHKRIIVGHSSWFDLKILKDEYERLGTEFLWDKHFRDTYLIARSLKLDVPDFKLTTLCQHFGIPLENAHTAMADVMATAELFSVLVKLKGNGFISGREPFRLVPTVGFRNCKNWVPRILAPVG